MPPRSARSTRNRPTLDARYEMVRPLGAGGMAEVVEARDRRLGRSVAIKMLRADLADPHARERFHREALTAAALAHPNIVAVYDVGEADGRPYIVMELVDGESLATRLAADGPLPPAAAVHVTQQLLAALGAAHAQGLVHRDVKPANMLLTSDGTLKLADFGIAQALAGASSLTQTGLVVGTLRYLAPEQLTGKPASPQSDLYAAGLVLSEMLAGDPPPALARTIDRALAKEPTDRFVSAAAMADALRPRGDTTITDAPASTALLPASDERPASDDRPPPTAPRPRSRRGTAVLATIVGLAMAVGALALLTGGDDEPSDAQATVPTTIAPAPVVTTPPTAAATTLPPTTLPPQTVAELIALLANDPEGFGPAGPDLLERLQKIEENPDRADHEASKALDRLEHWVEEGEISPAFGALTAQILTPLAESQDKDRGRGPGSGADFDED